MQLQDYVTAVSIYVPTLPTLSPATQYDCINRARRDLAAQSDVTMTVTPLALIATTASYAYPTVSGCDILSIYRYGVYGYVGNLRYQIKRWPAADYPMANFNGQPGWYWLVNRKIVFWPTPSINMNCDIKCKLRPVTLVLTSDVDNQITEEYSDACVFLAASYAALADSNFNLAEYMEKMFQRQLGRLPRDNM